ncbi:MAG: hypothetical protein ACRDYC_07360 [Acidimicrobiales bacterium]
MSQRLKVRRLTDEEGRKLQRLVRRGEGKGQADVIRYRRAMVVLGSAGGNRWRCWLARIQTSSDRVREMIHRFNEMGMASLDRRRAGGRCPRPITTDDEAFIVETPPGRAVNFSGRGPSRTGDRTSSLLPRIPGHAHKRANSVADDHPAMVR